MKDTTLTVGAYGIVVDEYGQVLMVRRDDSRTWAPPGGGVDADEMPRMPPRARWRRRPV